jgi:hypothetical protein
MRSSSRYLTWPRLSAAHRQGVTCPSRRLRRISVAQVRLLLVRGAKPPSLRSMPAPSWSEDAQDEMAMRFQRRSAARPWASTTEQMLKQAPEYETAGACLRWAIWCVETLYRLCD